MDKRSYVMLRIFINRYHRANQEQLIKFLPTDEKKYLLSLDITSDQLTPMLTQPLALLKSIHYSWIASVLSLFPESLQIIVLNSLNADQLKDSRETQKISIPKAIKTFIHKQLYHLLKGDEHLAIDYLPQTALFPLVKWSKPRLIQLIDFLGLYDAASEVRHIVSRDHLQNIYACLTPPQLHYLKICLRQKEQIVSPKLGIDLSKQDSTLLKRVLHRRGLLRLGRASCGEHPDLVWYLSRTLDTGRGNILLKEYQPESLPKITYILQQQILNIMNFITNEQL